jgi:hypothetical protein
VTAGTLGGDECLPSRQCDGYINVQNPNEATLRITDVESAPGGWSAMNPPAGCSVDPGSFLSVNTKSGLDISLPGGSTTRLP